MGGFHDVRLPETFSEGSTFGTGFGTRIVELDNFEEERTQRVSAGGRRILNLTRGIANIDALRALRTFFTARSGAAYSFRVKDWMDYATTPTGTTHRDGDAAITDTDVTAQSTADPLVFQMVQNFVSGPTTVTRNLSHIVSGTAVVAANGVPQSTGFTVNLLNGQISFTSAPATPVTFGCEFDIPMRATQDIDEEFAVAVVAVESGNLPSITLIEDMSPSLVNQERQFGGAINHGDMNDANVQMNVLDGVIHTFAPTVLNLKGLLPDVADLPPGGPYFVAQNLGSQTMTIEDTTATTIATLGATDVREIWLGLNASGSKTWFSL